MGKGRLEAFSDGVLAVAITLLVLDLPVDRNSPLSLVDQLRDEWPTFAAYVVSFLIIGVIWLNHHAIFRVASAVDHHVLVYNLMLLLFVTAIPFTTSTYAAYAMGNTTDARTAVLLYGIVMEGMALCFFLILFHIVRAGLRDSALAPQDARKLFTRYGLGSLIYPVITAIGFINAPTMLALYAVVIGYYLGPGLRALEIGH